jgi:hypothetical protein
MSCGLLAMAALVSAQDIPGTTASSPEDFKIEVTGSLWILDSGGTVSNIHTTLDLVNDLGARQQVDTFYGRLVYKPGRKHEIVIEGSPFRLDGNHTATKSFIYDGQQYTVSAPLQTHASLDYVFAGYQYNFLSGPAGHLGASVGGAFLNATATLSEPTLNATATRTQEAGLPLAGVEFRIFPIPSRIIDIDGGLRGMDFGSYGHYVEADVNGGIWFVRHIGLHAGYRAITALLQNTGTTSDSGQLDVRFHGPVFTASFKW